MSYDDPFGTAPQNPEPVSSEAPESTAPNPRPAVVETSGEVVVTLKGGRDYDAPWIVLHAPTVAAANALMTSELADLMNRVKNAAATFSGASAGGAPAQPQAQQTQAPAQRQAPPGAKEAPNGEERYCQHGKMEFKSGTAKATGKPYELFSCTAPRESQCPAQFLNKK